MAQVKTKLISLTLPVWVLDNLKEFAERCNVPLDAVVKVLLADWVQKERKIQTT